jgi:hypothetical protein
MSITRTLVAALAIATLAVPAAQAKPIDSGAANSAAIEQLGGSHPSSAQTTNKSAGKLKAAGAMAVESASERQSAGKLKAAGAMAVESASERPKPAPVGQPTWPAYPSPIAQAPAQAPAAQVADDGNGVDWTTIGLGLAGSLLVISGLAALTTSRRHRRLQRATA